MIAIREDISHTRVKNLTVSLVKEIVKLQGLGIIKLIVVEEESLSVHRVASGLLNLLLNLL